MTSINRRALIQSAGAMLAGFAIPKFDPPKSDRAVLWIVGIAGNPLCPIGFRAFEVGQESAREAGFEVLDSVHCVDKMSRFLARKEVSLKYAREQERLLLDEAGNSDLQDIGDGLAALWVEVA